MKIRFSVFAVVIICLFLFSCASKATRSGTESFPVKKKTLAVMGHTIQAGAFAYPENAARLADKLNEHNLDATYFKAPDGLFKVRFGNFPSKEQARQKAQSLRLAGIIQEYYIVLPEDYAIAKQQQYGVDYLREQLVKTAHDFIGVPYLWGGVKAETGFDCSGLAMTVYQLNGLNLPRHSAAQYDAGEEISREELQKGDLVFFTFSKRSKVSHVGIYIGDGRFIHAPSRGRKIKVDLLSSRYYSSGFIGARNYF